MLDSDFRTWPLSKKIAFELGTILVGWGVAHVIFFIVVYAYRSLR